MKKFKNISPDKDSFKLVAAVLASMIIIIVTWGVYFYPSAAEENKKSEFNAFLQNIKGSLRIFKNNSEPQDDKVNINDLRHRVFGDKIEQ